ncbi:MAG: hypothetical protein EON91_00865 [Brevundimonas sp.]|uniref:hypothetical protein n=1 Tax=Brevundimonas sp. TaxID=1871086 RepID=UPI00122A9EAF|nr:hypothetical protein [Brevundimonas sp.]RZJ19622.1 MAG: hypothetical protein EON91_00865 [Brevundimonas sp.]
MRKWVLIVLLAAVAACQPAERTSREAEPVERAEQKLISALPVTPYPEAKTVRLFVARPFAEVRAGADEYVRPKGQMLTADQRSAFEATLRLANYDRELGYAAACFIPHHFVRYYDASDRVIGEFQVCFCCTGIRADPHISAPLPRGAKVQDLEFDYARLKAWVEAMGYSTDIDC